MPLSRLGADWDHMRQSPGFSSGKKVSHSMSVSICSAPHTFFRVYHTQGAGGCISLQKGNGIPKDVLSEEYQLLRWISLACLPALG